MRPPWISLWNDGGYAAETENDERCGSAEATETAEPGIAPPESHGPLSGCVWRCPAGKEGAAHSGNAACSANPEVEGG